MNKSYLADEGIRKLFELIFAELDTKQDKMEEISKEEVTTMWEGLSTINV